MKSLLTILFITLTVAFYGQKLEVYAGLNLNQFHDYNNNGGSYTASFDSGLGPVIGIGIDSVRLDLLKLRFTLQYERGSGELDAYEGGQMYCHQTVADIKKSMLLIVGIEKRLK